MGVGINVSEDYKLYVGSDIDDIVKSFDEIGIEYKKSYDKKRVNGVRETIIDMPKDRITLEFKDGKLEYIRLNPCAISALTSDINSENINSIKEIKQLAVDKLGIEDYNVTFIKIDMSKVYMVMSATNKADKTDRYRIAVQQDGLGRVYIATMSVLRG